MKKLHKIAIVALTMLTASCAKSEATPEPEAPAMRHLTEYKSHGYTLNHTYNDGSVVEIRETTANAGPYITTLSYTPIIYIGEATSDTGSVGLNIATTSELKFTKSGNIEREITRKKGEEAIYLTTNYSYDDQGYISQIVLENTERKYTRTFNWNDGNLESINNTYYFKTMKYDFFEDITYTYNEATAQQVSHDPHLTFGDMMPIYPTAWYGKSSKNQIASIHSRKYNFNIDNSVSETINTLTFSYEYDQRGYPTAVTVHDALNDSTYDETFSYAD